MLCAPAPALIVFALFALTGCSATSGPESLGDSAPHATGSAGGGTTLPIDAAVAASILGTIIVDGHGMTAYVFDADVINSGASACVGECAARWPAITTTSVMPKVTGISGVVGTIVGVNGAKQITINGMPIYTYSNDMAPNEVTGQGIRGGWHALSSAGVKVSTLAGS